MTKHDPSPVEAIKRNLRLSLLDGAFAQVYANFTGTIFLPAFALILGAGSSEIGLLAAIPFLATVAQLFGSMIVERSASRRGPALNYAFLSRLFWLPVLLLIFYYGTTNPGRILLWFIPLFFLIHVLGSISGVSWLSWMASLVPMEIRGRFFGLRNSIIGMVTVSFTILGGLFLDWFKHRFQQEQQVYAFGILFGIGFSAAMLSTLVLKRKTEVSRHLPSHGSLPGLINQVWNQPNFRRLLNFGLLWSFAVNFSSPFFVVYLLRELHFTYTVVSLITIAGAIADLTGMGFWGHLSDQHGNRPIMLLCVAVGSLMPLTWLFTSDSDFSKFLLIPGLLMMGSFVFAGYNLSSVNMIFGSAPRENNSAYFALWNSVNGVFTALGAIAGGLFYDHGQALSGLADGLPGWSFKYLFFFSFLMRISTLVLLRRVREVSTPTLKLVRILRSVRAWTTTMGFHPLVQFFLPAGPENQPSSYWPLWKNRRN